MSVKRDFPDLPPIWMLGFATLAWVADAVLPLARFEGSAARAVGAVAMIAGIGLAAWAALWFARKRTSIEPREEPSALIVEGPFRLNRNPIYTGMAVALVGWAVWLGSLGALIAVLPFAPVIDRRFARGEEAALREAFGEEGERYIAATRRW